jgi:hypothetical protein
MRPTSSGQQRGDQETDENKEPDDQPKLSTNSTPVAKYDRASAELTYFAVLRSMTAI